MTRIPSFNCACISHVPEGCLPYSSTLPQVVDYLLPSWLLFILYGLAPEISGYATLLTKYNYFSKLFVCQTVKFGLQKMKVVVIK